MVFSSLIFLVYFLPLVLTFYFVAPRKIKNGVLFLASLVFYAWGEPVYVVLMLFSTLVDYIHGRLIHRFRGTRKAKLALISSVVINLGLLGFFKYSDFVIQTVNQVFGAQIPLLNLPLPIGISFYTFQTMSYTIDVYRGIAKPQNNIITFGTYVALFPQLIAGPIVRYSTIADELATRKETLDLFGEGMQRFVLGLGKKVLLANNIGLVWSELSSQGELSVLGAWLGILAFGFQIYFDFSGYSDMAIGLGKMFGFHFPENFNYPYLSKNITEFWRRWHISLGTWFREYVYIPLGGNRKGLKRQLFNIFVVWLCTGIWHGASWNFAVWGVYYCILLILEKTFLLKLLKKLPCIIQRLYTLLAVLVGWVIFAFDSLPEGLRYLTVMFGASGALASDQRAIYLLLGNLILFGILILASTPKPSQWISKLLSKTKESAAGALSLLFLAGVTVLCFAYLVDSSYNPFLYFRF